MQNTKSIIALFALAIALFGGVWYLFTSSNQDISGTSSVATTTVATSTSTQEVPKAGKPAVKKPTTTTPKTVGVGSLSYLMSLKQSLHCSIKATGPGTRSGMVYVGSGKLRADFTSSSMINDGTYLYSWMSGASRGLKLLSSLSVAGSAIANAGGIDPASSVSYACNPWIEDMSVFSPPSSISFSNSL